jgi:hypothetical protein
MPFKSYAARAAYRKTVRARYNVHKSDAKRRGIPFLLTFEEWMSIWIDSGKWEQRGSRSGQFCMARFGDQGAYEVGNVKIILRSANTSEARKGIPLPAEYRAKLSVATKAHFAAHPEARAATRAQLDTIRPAANAARRKIEPSECPT